MSVRVEGQRAVGAPVPARSGPSLTPVGAVVLILVVALVGGSVDAVTGTGLRLVFAATLVLGTAVAAALVRRDSLLIVVLTPPLVYVLASALSVLATPGGLGKLIDSATGWLVYGFPAMAGATGVAALIAAIRRASGRN